MGATTTETILLQVDIVSNNERLTELTKQARLAKEEYARLQAQVKAGQADANLLDAANTKLKATLAANSQETKVLTQANTAQIKSTQASAGSIEQLRAQLALGTAEYNKLSAAERDGTDAGQKLQATNKSLSDNLKVLESAIGDNRRSVGGYGSAIEPVIQQLIKLQEQQKHIPEGSAAYQQVQAKVIGFQQAVNDAGVKAGLSYEQTQAKLTNYGKAIQPATANLVKLEQEQKKVGEGSVEYAKIGFQIGKAAKEIEKIPAETKRASDSLKDAITNSGLFGDSLDKATKFTGQFKSGLDTLKSGFKGVKEGEDVATEGSKGLKIGLAEIGIGLLILAFTTLVSYFTQSAEGAKILKGITSGLGATFQVLTDIVSGTGRALALIFQGDFKAAAKQLEDQFSGIGSKIANAAKEGYNLVGAEKALIKSRQQLEIEDIKEQSRVNVLLRLTKDRSKSATEQLEALKEAGEIEGRLTKAQIGQQERELELIQRKIELKGSGSKADLLQEKAEKQKEIAQSLAAQDETNAKILTRESVFREKLAAERKTAAASRLARAKEAAAAAQVRREDAVKAMQTEVERALLTVQAGSAAELVLLQRKLDLAAALTLASDKKNAADRSLLLQTVEVEKQKLADAFTKKQVEEAKKATDATIKEREREYSEAKQHLDDYLAEKRAAIEQDQAKGLLSENQAQKALNALEKAGLAAELVNANDYGQKQGAIEKRQADAEIKEAKRVGAEKKKIKETERDIAEAALQAGIQGSDAVIEAFGKESDAGRAALAVKKVLAIAEIGIALEKQLAANAEAGAKISAEAPPVTVPLGIAYTIATDALAIVGAAASGAKILGFSTGGVVPGTGSTDTVPALLTPGEIVMNQAASEQHAPVLSYLNSLAGGVNFAPGFVPGRPTTTDGGLAVRAAGAGAYPTAAEIGAAVGRNVPTSIAVDDISRSQGRKANVRALTRL